MIGPPTETAPMAADSVMAAALPPAPPAAADAAGAVDVAQDKDVAGAGRHGDGAARPAGPAGVAAAVPAGAAAAEGTQEAGLNVAGGAYRDRPGAHAGRRRIVAGAAPAPGAGGIDAVDGDRAGGRVGAGTSVGKQVNRIAVCLYIGQDHVQVAAVR